MERRFFTVPSQKNPLIKIRAAAGHFATGSSHISHYIDISELKSSAAAAKEAARALAAPYISNTAVDVIVCAEGTEIIAAYLANELLQTGLSVMETDPDIHILTPMHTSGGNFIFHQNVQEKIINMNTVILVATASSGSTINRAVECLSYYGGRLAGIAAVFSAFPEIAGCEVNSLFASEDIPGYHFYRPSECGMCREGRKLDAIINSEGYTKI